MKAIDDLKERVREFANRHAKGPWAVFWLVLVSFTESSFFLLPPDVLLIAILLAGADRWIYYSSITTIASVLGGIFGYLIGFGFFELIGQRIVDLYNLQEQVNIVANLFSENAFWAIFVAAFTPIPYKVFTISAGLFKINFLIFVVSSLLGRGIRFFIEGYLMHRFGEGIAKILYKRFNQVSLIVGVMIIIVILYLA